MFVITITGPSGSGKTTAVNNLLKKYPDKYVLLKGRTTRSPRSEQERLHGEYKFIERHQFLTEMDFGRYLEANEYEGHYYGTSIEDFDWSAQQGKTIIRVLEPSGISTIKNFCRSRGIEVLSLYIHVNTPTAIYRYLTREPVIMNTTHAANRVHRIIEHESKWEGLDCFDYGVNSEIQIEEDIVEDIHDYVEVMKAIKGKN